MTETKRFSAVQRRYAKVEALWPVDRTQLPALTEQEALSAAKRLFRLGMGKAWTGKLQITSGNRYTWIRRGILYVNASRGWHHLVHDLSHLVHHRRHPGQSGHHVTHAEYETKLIQVVVSKGWLEGGLRRAAAVVDKKAVAHQRVLARIETWERKKKRADNALKKLYRLKANYEKRQGGA